MIAMVNTAQALVPFSQNAMVEAPEMSGSDIVGRLRKAQDRLTLAATGVTNIRERSKRLLSLTRQCTETWYKV